MSNPQDQLAINGGDKAITGLECPSQPKVGIEEFMELADTWTFSEEAKQRIYEAIKDEDLGGGPHLTRYYNPRPSKVDAMEAEGYQIEQINACGGGTKNALWIQEHADAAQRPVHLPKEPEAVLLGSAILGAVAAEVYGSIPEAMAAMCHAGEVVDPNAETAGYHEWKYRHQLAMYGQQVERKRE